MSQCIGYLLAAMGPLVIGALHERLGGWQLPIGLCIGLSLLTAVIGLLAGRNRHIGA